MRIDVQDNEFREAGLRWLRSLDDATIVDLRRVFDQSPGYYPTTLITLWRRELDRRGLVSIDSSASSRVAPFFPVSHPYDYDWRFTQATSEDLVRKAVVCAGHDNWIVHIGTPSTFAVGIDRHDGQKHVLLERNTAMCLALQSRASSKHEIILIDLMAREAPSLGASVAILDPPWYVADTLTFLAAGSHACREGAVLLVCQPTSATRPGAAIEREQITQVLPTLGLEVEEVHHRAVRYRTPHFEAMSLRVTEPRLDVPVDWRTGDLLIVRKTAPSGWEPVPSVGEQPWHEVRFGPVRIKLRATDATEDLASLVPGDVMDTVSRRDPIRSSVGFWTSGNRVYGLVDPHRVGKLIKLCNSDLEAMQFMLTRTLNHAKQLDVPASVASRLFDVLLVELQEHTTFEEPA